jgi:hypothetical protein
MKYVLIFILQSLWRIISALVLIVVFLVHVLSILLVYIILSFWSFKLNPKWYDIHVYCGIKSHLVICFWYWLNYLVQSWTTKNVSIKLVGENFQITKDFSTCLPKVEQLQKNLNEK